ncbi:MAG: putative transposase, partial [Chlamydiales bacterium]
MAWDNYKVEHQRFQLINAYIQGAGNMTNLFKRYGVSIVTGYKWLKRFLKYGEEGLKDLPKAPSNPKTIYSDVQIEQVIDLKLKHRTWGPKKIFAKLSRDFPDIDWPCTTRLYKIFKKHHLVTSRRIRKRVPATAPLGDVSACNDTWAVDFKGWFLTGDGQKCEPLTLTDSFSRYLIRCVYLKKHSVDYVWPIFDEAFREYGLPLKMRSDNGPPFATVGAGRLSRLSVHLIK